MGWNSHDVTVVDKSERGLEGAQDAELWLRFRCGCCCVCVCWLVGSCRARQASWKMQPNLRARSAGEKQKCSLEARNREWRGSLSGSACLELWLRLPLIPEGLA